MASALRSVEQIENWSARELIAWALEEYSPDITIVSSFSAEDVAVIDMAVAARPGVQVATLDTGRLPQETYEVMELVRARYGIRLDTFFPDTAAVEAMVREHGPNLFYESVERRKLCCHVRKVEPLERALANKRAWVTGLRREQSITRAGLPKLETEPGGRVKLNPLAAWTRAEVWDYVKRRGIPYNRLHDQGFPSIGCAPCTRAVGPGEDERAGRWWWENPEHKECGLHVRKR